VSEGKTASVSRNAFVDVMETSEYWPYSDCASSCFGWLERTRAGAICGSKATLAEPQAFPPLDKRRASWGFSARRFSERIAKTIHPAVGGRPAGYSEPGVGTNRRRQVQAAKSPRNPGRFIVRLVEGMH
jgi:hypothetical protein